MNTIINDRNLTEEEKKAFEDALVEVQPEIDTAIENADMEMIEESQNNLSDLMTGLEQVNKEVEKESDKMSVETDIALAEDK